MNLLDPSSYRDTKAYPRSRIVPKENGLSFETSDRQWDYALSIPVPFSLRRLPIVAEIEMSVSSGKIGIGAVGPNESEYVTNESMAKASFEVQKVQVYIPDGGQAKKLILRKVEASPGFCTGVLHSVKFQRFADYSPTEKKRLLASRFNYWHYSFDLGDGIQIEASLPGAMDSHVFNQKCLQKLLDSRFSEHSHKTVLDIACSSGFHSFALAKKFKSVVAVDSDRESIEEAELVQACSQDPQVHFHHRDLFDLKDMDSANLIHCSGLMYHLTDPVGAARIFYDKCTEGAVVHSFVNGSNQANLILSDSERFPCCFEGEFSLIPSQSFLRKAFQFVGFEVEEIKPEDLVDQKDFDPLLAHYEKLFREHTVYYVLKKD